MYNKLRILHGSAHPVLAHAIGDQLTVHMSEVEIKRFSNENIFMQLKESVRSKDVYIVQPFSSPVNDNIMELLIMLDTCKRASADRITAVIPYYAYGRTDKKDLPRVPITARLLADLITVAGAHRVITLDLHAQQIQGFFNIPVDELLALPLLVRYFKQKRLNLADVVVVSPDIGAAKRARDMAVMLGIKNQFAVVDKEREKKTGEVTVNNIIGDVDGKIAILVDEEINTGSSVLAAAQSLNQCHCREIYVCATHAVFSGDVMKNMTAYPFKEIVLTDTLPLPPEKHLPNMRFVPVAPLLGEVIRCIHDGRSLGQMLAERWPAVPDKED